MKVNWVFVAGTFDLFHWGHANLLEKARKLGPVVVAVNTDEFAERYKRRPVLTTFERLRAIEACRHVDLAVVNRGNEDCKLTILDLEARGITVRYVVHGDDWIGEGLMRQMGFTPGWLAGKNIELQYIPYTSGISSRDIEQRIRER